MLCRKYLLRPFNDKRVETHHYFLMEKYTINVHCFRQNKIDPAKDM